MTDAPSLAPSVPAPLDADALEERLRIIAGLMTSNDCGWVAILTANKAVDTTQGGTQENLLNAMDKLRQEGAGGVGSFIPRADFMPAENGEAPMVDTVEQTALLLAAVRLAKDANATNITEYLATLPADDRYFEVVEQMCEEIQATSCSMPSVNPMRGGRE
jgi:hypothetical protein